MAENYLLRVTAGPSYDPDTHKLFAVNTAEPLRISNEHCELDLNVRVQDYRGLPHGSPSTNPYFTNAPHSKNNDQYSIAFRFKLKSHSVNGDDLIFGNDFDHPIRDRLPPGFNVAFRIVKWAIDPGLDGDVYADEPYLYGCAGSSVNALHVGAKSGEKGLSDDPAHIKPEVGLMPVEGAYGNGIQAREDKGMPTDEASRKKWFLTEANRKNWEWEEGREYACDFFNPYLDFNRFALRLPGFTLPIMKYWDGQSLRQQQERRRSHALRYVLKNRATGQVYFVLVFTLLHKTDVNEDGSVKEGVLPGKPTKRIQSENSSISGNSSLSGEEKSVNGKDEFNDDGVD